MIETLHKAWEYISTAGIWTYINAIGTLLTVWTILRAVLNGIGTCLAILFWLVLPKQLKETVGFIPEFADATAKIVKVAAAVSLVGVVIYAGLKLSDGRRA